MPRRAGALKAILSAARAGLRHKRRVSSAGKLAFAGFDQ